MDHRAAKLIEVRCRKDASILYRLKPLFYLIWALLALTRTGHLSPIIRESQILLAPFPVIRPVDVCAYIRDGYDEIQRRKEKSRIEGFLAFLNEPTGRAVNHGWKAVLVIIAFQPTRRFRLPVYNFVESRAYEASPVFSSFFVPDLGSLYSIIDPHFPFH